MSDAWIRGLTMSAMVLLVLHAVGSWVYSVLGITAAIASDKAGPPRQNSELPQPEADITA